MNNYSRFLQQKRFGSLDGLRAISILAVIWHHTSPDCFCGPFGYIGTQGVTLFFAISGFLITTLMLREQSRTGHIDLKAFYLRRTFRIFPLYFGTLLLYILVVTFFEKNIPEKQAFFENLKYFATFTSNIFVPLNGRVIFYFAWSVATEEQFYLIWPTLLFLSKTVSKSSIFLCAAILACITDQLLGNPVLMGIPVAIMGGALLANILHTEKGFNALNFVLGRSWSFVALFLCLAATIVNPSVPSFVVHLLFVAIVGSCVVREDHPFARLLSFKPIAYIGSISYGIYMLHVLCKNVSVKILHAIHIRPDDGMELFWLTLALSIVVATISFKYYESFFLKLKSRYER